MKDPTEPDTDRTPTEADLHLAGQLSTIWPMSHRHPMDCVHMAIFINDRDAQLHNDLAKYKRAYDKAEHASQRHGYPWD